MAGKQENAKAWLVRCSKELGEQINRRVPRQSQEDEDLMHVARMLYDELASHVCQNIVLTDDDKRTLGDAVERIVAGVKDEYLHSYVRSVVDYLHGKEQVLALPHASSEGITIADMIEHGGQAIFVNRTHDD